MEADNAKGRQEGDSPNPREEPADQVIETYLNSLFENSPEAIVLLDNQNRVIRINSEFTRLFGYRQEEIGGEHIDSLIARKGRMQEAARFSRMAEKKGGRATRRERAPLPRPHRGRPDRDLPVQLEWILL